VEPRTAHEHELARRRRRARAVLATAAIVLLALVVSSPPTRPASAAPAAGAGSDDSRRSSAVVLPDEATVLQGLRSGHPRLILTPPDVVALRQRILTDPTTAAMYATVKARAQALVGQPVLTYDKPDGFRLLETSRAAVRRLYDLGLVWLVDQDPAIAARGAAELEAVSAFPDWNPIHFLDTGEMSHAVGIGYDWLYDALTPTQRTTIATALVAKGLTPAHDAYLGTAPFLLSYWVLYDHNWALVTNGGVTLGALAIADEQPALARTVVHEALSRVPPAMAHYAPDGGWPEGVSYWEYATEYAGYLVAGLDTALGTDFGLTALPGFSTTGDVPAQLTGPTGQRYNWADDGEPRYAPSVPFLFWTAERFGRPQDRAYQLAHLEPHALDVVWYRASAVPVPAAPLDRLFRGIDVTSMRQAWDDPAGWWVGAKGGRPWFNHNQLDAGSFALEAQGERWAIDLGKEDYNVPGYWESGPGGKRWTYFRSRAESHNTLVLDLDACEDQDPTATSVVTRFRSASGGAFTITDLTGAYRGTPVRRGVGLLDGRSHVVVQDELSPTKATDLWWFVHTRAQITLTDGDRTAVLVQGGKTLRASLVGLPGATFSVTPATPLPGSPPADNTANPGVQRLTIHTTVSGPTSYAVVFDDGSPAVPTTITPLDQWQVSGTGLVAVDREPVPVTPAANPCKGIVGPTTTTTTAPPPTSPASVPTTTGVPIVAGTTVTPAFTG